VSYLARVLTDAQAADVDVRSEFWDLAEKSPRFVNIVNGQPATYGTHAAVVWSRSHLYVKYWVQEPFLRATFEERDSLLFNENNVELFIDGGDVYYELEVNARNVVYEVLFLWQDAMTDSTNELVRDLDPIQRGAITFGGNHDRNSETFWTGTHPRGLRWAFTDWDLPGLQTQVALDGTLNDDSDVDQGWEVLISIPWEALHGFAGERSLPPSPGDVWTFQFARYERLAELDLNVGWAWTPVGSDDNHRPERFTAIEFSETHLGD